MKNLCYCVQLQDVVWEEAYDLDLEKTLMIQFDLQESFELPLHHCIDPKAAMVNF